MDQSGLHTTYGLSSVYSAEVPSWCGRVVIRWFAGLGFPPLIWWVFPSWNSSWFICPCSALTRPYRHYGDFFPVTSLISSLDWAYKDSPTDFCTNFLWLKPCDSDQYLIASDLGFRSHDCLKKMVSDWGFRFHDCLYGSNFGACSMITNKNGSQKMVQENGEKRARKENGTRNNTDSCWCFIWVLIGFSTMIIDKHWGPSCQASDPWRQNGLRAWGHTLFLRASRSSWSFPNMFHSSRGAGCPCKYQPNEEACMRHWYHWRCPVTYLPFIF